jgi:isoleucyl-tRNA synthetase
MADEPKTGRDYRETLFLPETDFPMRGGLPQKEPEILARWDREGLYGQMRKAAAGRPAFVFHDGPPYANGPIHIGHALNKTLKDLVVRSQGFLGFDADFIPGWDCHGLPIEWKVEEDFRAKGKKKEDVDPVTFRKACREWAGKWIPLQLEEFKRLGVNGDWAGRYETMSFKAEAAIAAEFHKVVRTGLVYRGSKPVMWSPVERTSLAEAEVEYQDKTSPTIWVKFPVVDAATFSHADPDVAATTRLSRVREMEGVSIVIWTTTPWTIPGNRAISYSPAISYGVYEVQSQEQGLEFAPWAKVGEKLALADKLAEEVMKAAKVATWTRVSDCDPARLVCAHPLSGLGYDFSIPLLAGDHVTDDAGTGFVHTAPGHGADDFAVWLKSGFSQKDIPFTVDEAGCYTKEAPGFEGLAILQLEGKNQGKDAEANKAVIQALIESGNLLARGTLRHSYPHSWRSKAPLIFRNTPQWFIAMDKPYLDGKTLREVALAEIERVDWGHEGAKNRIKGMVAERPDWLISRQRNWGVPLAMFVHKETGEILIDDAVDARIVKSMEEGGADAWWATDAQVFLGGAYKAEDYEKVEDILDVWFDSGSTHAFVLGQKPNHPWPADLYLEGSDQHRGWFQSSLLEGCVTRGRAPFNQVRTHGFTMDEEGRKMSKSLGNVIEPQTVFKQYGAEILRLMTASVDYEDDQRFGKSLTDGSAETYRKLRNTLRYLLGALKGFDNAEAIPLPLGEGGPKGWVRGSEATATQASSYPRPLSQGESGDVPLLETWLLHRLAELDLVVREAYRTYQFRDALTAIVEFCNVDLSAFYVDVRKDALYCDIPTSLLRRACRTALSETFDRLCTWLAPILPFTTEEAWGYRYPDRGSVHLQTFPETPAAWRNANAQSVMAILRGVRGLVTAALEVERREKRIGSSLEAAPILYIPEAHTATLVRSVDFAELCIVSAVTVVEGHGPADAFRQSPIDLLSVVPTLASGQKCARSWKFTGDVGSDPRYPDLSARDAEAVAWWDAQHGR